MCIICNCTFPESPDPQAGDTASWEFLARFQSAQVHMKAAAKAMLECSKYAYTPEIRAHYDHIHKMMVRQIKDWNRLEELRENP